MNELVAQVRPGKDGDLSQITEFLWLGNTYSAQNEKILLELNVEYILNVKDGKSAHPEGMNSLHVLLSDLGLSDLSSVLDKCFQFINSGKSAGKCVLVHCQSGRNRSAAIVTAYLMKTKKWTLQEALDYLEEKRPLVGIHTKYIQQLLDFEKTVFQDTNMTQS